MSEKKQGGARRTTFSRYFTLCASITLASVAVLELLLTALTANYFSKDRLSSMQTRATQAASFVAQNYEENQGKYIDSDSISRSFVIMSAVSEANILLTDANGSVIYAVSYNDEDSSVSLWSELIGAAVDTQANQKLLDGGSYRSTGKMSGISDRASFIVGVPITSRDVVIGGIFMIVPITNLAEYLREMMKLFLLGAALATLFSFWVLYYSTEEMIRPLRAMSQAAESFARGDFSVRVPVEGDEEIEQLARAFNEMAESLAMQEMTGRTFVANVSHELKTPMTTIGGFIDGILDGTIPQEKSHYYLEIVSTEVKRLSRMVVSMLNISRIEAGEMQINPRQTDLSEIVCSTLLGFEQRIEGKQIDVQGLDTDKVYVEADPDLVNQIVYNLIENAVKFTPERGVISVSYKTEGRMVVTAIRNTGDGIPKEEMARLFDRFYKSDRSRSMDKSGVGLGLHIVKSLVHLHGGDVGVESVEGEYTEFSFSLPLFVQKNVPVLFRKAEKPQTNPAERTQQ
jgi:signal transduction histidine kinase